MLGTLWSDILLALEVHVISTVFGMVRSVFVISTVGGLFSVRLISEDQGVSADERAGVWGKLWFLGGIIMQMTPFEPSPSDSTAEIFSPRYYAKICSLCAIAWGPKPFSAALLAAQCCRQSCPVVVETLYFLRS